MIERIPNASTARMLVAKNDDQENLFVRLSPDVLSALVAKATAAKSSCQQPDDDTEEPNTRSNSRAGREWRLKPDAASHVSFLPLEILVGDDCIIYASYNGGLLPEDSKETIQVPNGLLPSTSVSGGGGRVVQVRALDRVRYATSVQVDPLTTEDWELLQVHAELLEAGAFLKQLSLVYRDQILRLTLPITNNHAGTQQRDTIQMVVQDMSTTEMEKLSSSPWPELPDDYDATSYDDANDVADHFVLLANDTEIIITPKPRVAQENRFDPSSWSKPLQVVPCSLDIQREELTALQDKLSGIVPLQLAPQGCILVHPDSIAWDTLVVGSDWVQMIMTPAENGEGKVVVARLLALENIPEGCAVIHPWIRFDLGLALFWDHVQLRPSLPPVEIYSMSDIDLRKISLKSSSNRQWRHPDMQYGQPPLVDELDEDLAGRNLQLPVGSIIALSSTYVNQSEDRRKRDLFRIVPRASTGNDLEGMVCLQPDDVGRLQKLASTTCSRVLEQLERPPTDLFMSVIPRPIFKSTLDALGSFSRDLQRDVRFLGMICGATGSGKTHTAVTLGAVARMDHRRATLYLDCRRLQESTTTIVEILAELDELFDSACTTKQCLIIMDDLDRIAPNLLGGNEGDPGAKMQGANPTAIDQSKLISDRILQLFEAANTTGYSSVSIVATCASANSLNTGLCHDQKTANVPEVDSSERLHLFAHMLSALGLPMAASLPDAMFGQPTEGFRPRDLEKVAARVRRYFALHEDTTVLAEATETVLRDVIPLAHMELDKPRAQAGLAWDEIGGLFHVKERLEATLLKPMKYRAIYDRAKIRLPRGVLLLGPTGCGKTALVPALAKECQFPLISCKGPEILDKYIGASEAKIRELFKRAASVAPSILFLDELDALAPRRGSDHTGVTDRVVNQLLTFLDGVEDTSNATVYVIGASSRPDKIDPALLRPGRLEQHLFVGPPDKDEEWLDLFRQIAGGWNLSPRCRGHFFAERGAEEVLAVVKKNPLFCPADIKATMDTAQLNAVHRTLNMTKAEDVHEIVIEIEDLRLALLKMRPCLSRDDAAMLAEIYQRYYHADRREPNTTTPPHELKTTLR